MACIIESRKLRSRGAHALLTNTYPWSTPGDRQQKQAQADNQERTYIILFRVCEIATLRFVLEEGQLLKEVVLLYGLFVMNMQEEIKEAMRDYK